MPSSRHYLCVAVGVDFCHLKYSLITGLRTLLWTCLEVHSQYGADAVSESSNGNLLQAKEMTVVLMKPEAMPARF